MNASKENCRMARQHLKLFERRTVEYEFIEEFLDAAERKLPSEDSFERDGTPRKRNVPTA